MRISSNQEKENLALNKAMSDYDSVVAKGSEGLFQKEGFSAGGISEEFSKMSRDASELPMESLREYSPETMERFRLHVQGRETSYAPGFPGLSIARFSRLPSP